MTKRSRPARDAAAAPAQVIPIVEEQVVVLKRKTLTEGVRVHTTVRKDEAVIDEPVATETVDVERVPLDRWVEGPVPVRQEGDTTIITLVEEVVVVEKRLRATEEIRLTKRRDVERHTETVTLRREEAVVERVNAAGEGIRDGDPLKDESHENEGHDARGPDEDGPEDDGRETE